MSVKFKETIEQNIQGGMGGAFGQGGGGGMGGAFGQAAGAFGQATGMNPNAFGRGAMGGAMGAAGFGSGNGGGFGPQGRNGNGNGNGKHHGFAHDAGEFLTRGGGAGGYLQAYLKQLEKYPLRTKMLTSGSLAGLQELLASWIAQDRSKHGHYFSSRIPKMAAYGALISAPMAHFLMKILQFLFAGRSSLKAKVMQILVSNLIVSPIQNSIYLVSMAIIAGARTFHQIRATVRAGFWPVMRVSWISSPIALAFAQAFLPEEAWVPFFNVLAFVIGTYINTITKKKRLAALRRKYSEGRGDPRDDGRQYARDEVRRTEEVVSGGVGGFGSGISSGISGGLGGIVGSMGGMVGGRNGRGVSDERVEETTETYERRDY